MACYSEEAGEKLTWNSCYCFFPLLLSLQHDWFKFPTQKGLFFVCCSAARLILLAMQWKLVSSVVELINTAMATAEEDYSYSQTEKNNLLWEYMNLPQIKSDHFYLSRSALSILTEKEKISIQVPSRIRSEAVFFCHSFWGCIKILSCEEVKGKDCQLRRPKNHIRCTNPKPWFRSALSQKTHSLGEFGLF